MTSRTTTRGEMLRAVNAKLTPTEERAWAQYKKGKPHACVTAEDWADLFATICDFKRRIMLRNGVKIDDPIPSRRERIMQHV